MLTSAGPVLYAGPPAFRDVRVGREQAARSIPRIVSETAKMRTVGISTEQEFNRYSIAAFDFDAALRFAGAAQRHPENLVEYEALFVRAIVSYVRPFSGNEKSPRAEATSKLPGSFIESLSGTERELHEQCVSLRNQALAHSEHSKNPTRLRRSEVVASRPFSLLTPSFGLLRFVRLVEGRKVARERERGEYVLSRRRRAAVDQTAG
jgi:hypothetical protein